MFSFPRRMAAVVVCCGFYCAFTAEAGTLVSVSGGVAGGYSLSNNPGVGFSLANNQTNVSITIPMIDFAGGGDWNLDAYLTTQIGPGTTPASHEVAYASQIISVVASNASPPLTITQVTVFSGLNLSAGTYYLSLSGSSVSAFPNVLWSFVYDVTTATNEGASVTNPGYVMVSPASYLPATSPSYYKPAFITTAFWFTVTEEPLDNNIPEPATAALTLAGCLVLLHLRRGTPRQ